MELGRGILPPTRPLAIQLEDAVLGGEPDDPDENREMFLGMDWDEREETEP